MPPLSQSLKSKIKHAFTSSAQHSNVDIQTATMAKLYSALQQTSWTAHATMGKSAIVLARDRKLAGTPKLYLVDIETSRIVWEQEIYKNFQFIRENEWFYTFAGTKTMIGLSFRDPGDASMFAAKVDRETGSSSTGAAQVSRPAASVASRPAVNRFPSNSALSGPTTAVNPVHSSSSILSSSKPKKKGKLDKSQIGAPTNFQHTSHIGFDQNSGGFDVRNVPPDWQNMFKAAGVTNDQLQDEKTAEFIYKFLKKKGAVDAEGKLGELPTGRKMPPPPPPPQSNTNTNGPNVAASKMRGAPPPPPPSRRPTVPPAQANNALSPEVPSINHNTNASVPPPPPPHPVAITSPPPPMHEEIPVTIEFESRSSVIPPPPPPAPANISPAAPPTPQRPKQPQPTLPDVRNDLLSSIKGAGGLKALRPAAQRTQTPPETNDDQGSSGDLASALANALANRKNAMGDSDEESGHSSGDDDWE